MPDEKTSIIGFLVWGLAASLAVNVAQWRERVAERGHQRKEYELLLEKVLKYQGGSDSGNG